MEIKDPKVVHDYLNGVIEGENVKKSIKLYSDAKKFYKSVDSSVSDDQITLLTELSEEESRIWRQTKQVSSEAAVPKFSDIISEVLRKKNDRK